MFSEIVEKYGSRKKDKSAMEKIQLVESMIGFELPHDYRQFVERYEGFENIIGKEFIRLWDVEDLIQSNVDYQIFNELEHTIGIGTNGGGEFIAIEKIAINEFRIILSPLIDLSKKYHIEIGLTFTDFLIRLEKGEEWFENNN